MLLLRLHEAKTAIITKSLLGKSTLLWLKVVVQQPSECNQEMAGSYFHDTMKGSKWLANWQMAEYHAKKA